MEKFTGLCDPETHSVDASMKMYERTLKVLPGAAGTFSKSASQMAMGTSPMFLKRAEGSRVWDVDGNEYIDYMLGLGPIILGHGYPAVKKAQIDQLEKGQAFSLSCPLEMEVAELICEMVPCAEMVRFGKNGSDVTSAAVKLARHVTGRDHIAAGGYHGWQDWYIGCTERAAGIPQEVRNLTHRFNQQNPKDLERLFNEYPKKIAAVILEPAMHSKAPDAEVLKRMKEITHREGALLIFDEVITGFRLDKHCVQGMTGVVPDLCTLGKALANGAPVSAIAGKREYMKYLGSEVFFSFTFAGEAVSLAAAKKTLEIIRDEPVVEQNGERGASLRDGFNSLAKKHGIEETVSCIGPDQGNVIIFNDHPTSNGRQTKTYFIKEVARRGILNLGYHNISYSHSQQDVDITLRVYDEVLEMISVRLRAGDLPHFLECPEVAAVFRAK